MQKRPIHLAHCFGHVPFTGVRHAFQCDTAFLQHLDGNVESVLGLHHKGLGARVIQGGDFKCFGHVQYSRVRKTLGHEQNAGAPSRSFVRRGAPKGGSPVSPGQKETAPRVLPLIGR